MKKVAKYFLIFILLLVVVFGFFIAYPLLSNEDIFLTEERCKNYLSRDSDIGVPYVCNSSGFVWRVGEYDAVRNAPGIDDYYFLTEEDCKNHLAASNYMGPVSCVFTGKFWDVVGDHI